MAGTRNNPRNSHNSTSSIHSGLTFWDLTVSNQYTAWLRCCPWDLFSTSGGAEARPHHQNMSRPKVSSKEGYALDPSGNSVHSYWIWAGQNSFIVSFPSKNGGSFQLRDVNVYQRVEYFEVYGLADFQAGPCATMIPSIHLFFAGDRDPGTVTVLWHCSSPSPSDES